MIYRRIVEEDYPQIAELCVAHNVTYNGEKPFIGFVGVNDEGKVVGFILTHQVMMIEPFISESDTVAVKLYYMMEGALSTLGAQNVIAHTRRSNEKLVGELHRVGFSQISSEYSLFKRRI